MYKRTKVLFILVSTLLLVGILTNCASMSQMSGSGTITVAVVESNPGTDGNPAPQSVYAGVKLAVDQFGRNGANVQVDLYDDNNDPAEAVKIAEKIAESNAVAIIGHSSIETSDAAGTIYDKHQIPVINVIPVPEHLTEDHPYHFNVTYTAESEAAYLASYLIKINNKVTAGIIHTDDEQNEKNQEEFRNMFAKYGGVVSFRETVTLGEPLQTDQPTQDGELQTSVPATQLTDAVVQQLNEIVARIAAIPDVNKPSFLFITASDEITTKLQELLSAKGVSIPIKKTEILQDDVIAGMISRKTASIISTSDTYGQTLASQFRNTFQGLGGEIVLEENITSQNPLPQQLEGIVSDIISGSNPGTIFIATDDRTAADLVILMKQKGVSYPIVGASNLSTPNFLTKIKEQDEEKTFPGYYTNGILTTRAIIFDSANRYANQFLDDYQKAYKSNSIGSVSQPGDKVIAGYDAMLVLANAAHNSDVNGSDAQVSNRQKIYKALLNMDKAENSVQGIIAPIFFEPSRNITRAAHFGVYQNGELVSANIQFEPISTPSEIKDLQNQINKGRIMTVNGGYVYKANVVYAGVDILSIEEIDIKTSTYNVDFYLWFRYRPNDQDADFKPDDFIFTNASGDVNSTLIRDETNSGWNSSQNLSCEWHL